MNIGFDLDNTLIPYTGKNQFETEKRTLIRRLLRAEPLRLGTIKLIKSLQSDGHSIWIYTSSYRPKKSIKKTFLAHGIKLNGIVNQKTHDKMVKQKNIAYSKHPPSFGINLLVDDSKGVELEGVKAGFKTLIIKPSDNNWTNRILNAIAEQKE